ncbi:MAG: hypothetical protein WC291_00510 [Thermodesulfovibrionales bacterium]|jgi:hypothetical protein
MTPKHRIDLPERGFYCEKYHCSFTSPGLCESRALTLKDMKCQACTGLTPSKTSKKENAEMKIAEKNLVAA